MGSLQPPRHEMSARYAAMEKTAGTTLTVLSLVAVACIILLQPGLWFTLGSLLAGVLAYWCWRAMLASRPELGVAVAVAAVLAFLLAAVPAFTLPLPLLMTMGLSHFGVGLYAALLVRRTIKGAAGHEI